MGRPARIRPDRAAHFPIPAAQLSVYCQFGVGAKAKIDVARSGSPVPVAEKKNGGGT
jgi:hypothetical protein